MDIVKFVGIGIIICIVVILLKQVKPELSLLVVVAGGVMMLLYILTYFTDIFSSFRDIINKSGIDSSLFSVVLKIIGVGYLVEFGASICNDSGNSSIGDKIILGGKVIIFTMALPIITTLFNMLLDLIK